MKTINKDRWVRFMPEYGIWGDMKRRCANPKIKQFKDYGGRGIRVCAEWQNSFATFLKDMGPRPSPLHSIDRKDNDGHYCPENCHWATRQEQSLNTSRNMIITAFGRTAPLKSFISEEGGANEYKRVWRRISERGWDAERALTAPLDNRGGAHPK